jgi:hypothetical protein
MNEVTPCVLYAAKSTEDRHGSIPDQLHDCRVAIDEAGSRHIHAGYTDEAVSAFSSNRGQGLVDAMQHAEDLAREFGGAELWAQHSDRLARGDGRLARHVVEIGLWALKRDITVRTIQDPDTFRDLLYAVVTGQRNHEDSRRKSLAVIAGHRRAAERGVCIGPPADGYRRVIEIARDGTIVRRVEIDNDRRPLIELIFRLLLRGKSSGVIARTVNDAGWLTKPNRRGSTPRSWTCHGVRSVAKNPRYAGLTALNGEILGHASWPAYVTEREHLRLKRRFTSQPRPSRDRPREAFLFARLAVCGYCGRPMQVYSGRTRKDGTYARRYLCPSHNRDRSADACPAPRIDADMAESMFVAMIPLLFGEDQPPAGSTEPSNPQPSSWAQSAERQQVINAVLAGDEQAIDGSLELLLARSTTSLAEQLAARNGRARQVEVAGQFEAWAKAGIYNPTMESRIEAARLNAVLRTWLSRVTIARDRRMLSISLDHQATGAQSARRASVSIVREEWRRFLPPVPRTNQPHAYWDKTSIVIALQQWAAAHGHAPRVIDWTNGSVDHPTARTVRRHFSLWRDALKAARLPPANPNAVRQWSDEEILRSLKAWARRHGRAPGWQEWRDSNSIQPSGKTIRTRFGSWTDALKLAGLEATA